MNAKESCKIPNISWVNSCIICTGSLDWTVQVVPSIYHTTFFFLYHLEPIKVVLSKLFTDNHSDLYYLQDSQWILTLLEKTNPENSPKSKTT